MKRRITDVIMKKKKHVRLSFGETSSTTANGVIGNV